MLMDALTQTTLMPSSSYSGHPKDRLHFCLLLCALCCPWPRWPKITGTHPIRQHEDVQRFGTTALPHLWLKRTKLLIHSGRCICIQIFTRFTWDAQSNLLVHFGGRETNYYQNSLKKLCSWQQWWKHSVVLPWKSCRMKTASLTIILNRK